jgi:hypothetical protein
MRIVRSARLLAALVSLALAACGGGGSSSPTVTFPQARSGAASAGADLTAANADDISAGAVRALLSQVLDGAATTASADPSTVHAVARVAQRASAARLGGATSFERPQAVVSASLPCLSGSGTATGNIADPNTIRAGDTISATLFNCVLDATLPAASGQFTFRYDIVEISGNDLVAAALTLELNAFEVDGLPALSGTIHLYERVNGDGSQRSFSRYDAVRAVSGGTVQILDWDLDETVSAGGHLTLSLSGGLQVGAQIYGVQQVTPYNVPSASTTPTGGRLDLLDAQGDRVSISASGTQVLRAFLPAAAAAQDLPTRAWSDFLN